MKSEQTATQVSVSCRDSDEVILRIGGYPSEEIMLDAQVR